MIDDILEKHPYLFEGLAEKWHETTGGELLLVSAQGKVLKTSNSQNLANLPATLPVSQTGRLEVASPADGPAIYTPLIYQGGLAGFLLALNTDSRHTSLLDWVAEVLSQQSDHTRALQDMTDELIEAWDQLELIYRVTKTLGSQANLSVVLRSIIQEICKVVDTEDGFVLLESEGVLESAAYSTSTGSKPVYDRELLKRLLSAGHLVLCENEASCREFWPAAPKKMRNFIGMRIPTANFASAAIGLINNQARMFTAGDVKLLTAMADHIGAIIDNFLLHKQLIAQERVRRELEIAAEIQTSLHPRRLPTLEGITLSVASLPASEVGGDFYDFVSTSDKKLTIIVGDVAGKGIPAAMLTSMTRMMLRVEASHGQPPHKIIEQANAVLHQDLSQADSFVTAFVVTIDTGNNVLSFANAAHTPAILWRAQTRSSSLLRATSLPIGITGYDSEPSQRLPLLPGDVLALYTDGITEAHNPEGELFGIDRLQALVDEYATESPGTLQGILLHELDDFRQSVIHSDDATIVILKLIPQISPKFLKGNNDMVRTIPVNYPADIAYLTDISSEVTRACRLLANLPADQNGDKFIHLVELAVSEICTNIIQHSYAGSSGRINVEITLFPIGIQIDFFDNGQSFDPASVPPPLTNPLDLAEGGYGLYIVRKVMDLVHYEPETPRGNHWKLVKYLPAHHRRDA
ncbi:MAG: SpoIIE family protein phosphatase [Anaerolineae bacterium]